MNTDYIDRTLVKLKRQYTENETIQALGKRLSDKSYEIGQLKAEIDELKYKLKAKDKKIQGAYKQANHNCNQRVSSLQSKLAHEQNKNNKYLKDNAILTKQNNENKKLIEQQQTEIYDLITRLNE